jgi:[acyl-carrier-protein] S-malonyltransferase
MNKTAILFPGQGAQAVGMGRDLAEASPAARAVFDEANDAVGMALDKLCFDGPIEELSRSDVAQPAILAMSIAALRAYEEASGAPVGAAVAAGLSLGEYTALVAAGALPLRDAVRLVRARGTFMQEACEANPGVMYSIIGLDDAVVEEACRQASEETGDGAWPANYNSPGQLVISGQTAATARAAELCKEAGARRALQLQVAGAFHTPLMQAAADKLAAELAATDIAVPDCPVVANVTGEPVDGADDIRRLLTAQVTSPVRWTSCMSWCLGRGIAEFAEFGPGRVLSGLLRRIDRNAVCTTINSVESLAKATSVEGD